MRSDDPLFLALVAAVATGRRPAGATASRADGELEPLVDLAIRHRVVGSLASALREEGHPVPERLAAAMTAATADHLRAMRAIRRIAAALDGAGVRWAVVKGPVLATRWPGPATARSFQDIDLLVAPAELSPAIAALASAGFDHRNHNWRGFRRLGVGEVPLADLDADVVVDLHWHLIGLASRRRWFHLPSAELLERTVQVDVGGTTVPTLDDLDTLVHLCVHDALAGAQTLVELRDVHLVASAVSATAARDRLRRARASRLASVVIDRAERLFGPLGPRPIAAALCDAAGWVGLNRALDAGWGRVVSGGWTPFPGLLARVGRPTSASTVAALAEEVGSSAAARVGGRTLTAPGGPLDWSHRDGGDAERGRYLDDVASGAFGG